MNRVTENYGREAILIEKLLFEASQKGRWEYKSVETLLKANEISLPKGVHFFDKDGVRRHEIRVR